MQQVVYDLWVPENPNPSVAVRRCGFMFTFIRCLSDFGYGISFRFEPLKCLKFVKSPLSIASSTYFLLEAGIFPKLAFIEFLFSRVSTLTNFNSRVVLVYYRRVFEVMSYKGKGERGERILFSFYFI